MAFLFQYGHWELVNVSILLLRLTWIHEETALLSNTHSMNNRWLARSQPALATASCLTIEPAVRMAASAINATWFKGRHSVYNTKMCGVDPDEKRLMRKSTCCKVNTPNGFLFVWGICILFQSNLIVFLGDPKKKQELIFHWCKGKQWILADMSVGKHSVVGAGLWRNM